MAEQPPGTRTVLLARHRRIVIQSEAEIGPRQLVVIGMRIDAKSLEHCLRKRLEQRLVSQHEPSKPLLICGVRPEFLSPEWPVPVLRNVKRAPAPYPALDQVRVNLAGFFEREKALSNRSEPRRAEA